MVNSNAQLFTCLIKSQNASWKYLSQTQEAHLNKWPGIFLLSYPCTPKVMSYAAARRASNSKLNAATDKTLFG